MFWFLFSEFIQYKQKCDMSATLSSTSAVQEADDDFMTGLYRLARL